MSLICRSRTEREKARHDTVGPGLRATRQGEALVAGRAGGPARSSGEASVMGAERRGRVVRGCVRSINQAFGLGGVAWTS